MPNPIIAGVGGSIFSGLSQKSAADKAASAQTRASNQQIAETRRQFDLIQGLLKPYVTAGTTGLQGQLDLMGMNGQPAQGAAIQGIAGGEQFQALAAQGEEAMLANAAATGGLRGGNTQGALAQFRPQMLQSLIDRQLAAYGGLAANGQNAAGMTGTAAQNAGAQINAALGDRGAAQAGGYLAAGQANQNMFGAITGGLGQFAGANGGQPAGATLFQRWGF